MATVIETTRTKIIPPPNSAPKTNGNRKFRSEESINRFLIKNKGYEYINGKLEKKEMPTARHSGIVGRIIGKLGIQLKSNSIGRIYAFAHFQIGDNKRLPDLAFISSEKIPQTGEPETIWGFAPDIAIEVISLNERHNAVEQKIEDYSAAGVLQVWIINPKTEKLTVYFSPVEAKIYTKNDTLDFKEIFPNFSLKLSDIFID